MHAQRKIDGNEYFLLEAVIGYRKNGSALSVEDQRIVIKKGKKRLESQQLDGTFVVSIKTAPHYGRSYPI